MRKLITLTLLILISPTSWANLKFTDTDFDLLAAQYQTGIIYLWSPLMPLSTVGRDEITPVADELNVHLTTLIDPFSPSVSPSPSKNDPILASRKLMSLGMLDHFPAIVIYRNGHLLENSLVHGYEPPETLKQLLKSFLEKETL